MGKKANHFVFVQILLTGIVIKFLVVGIVHTVFAAGTTCHVITFLRFLVFHMQKLVCAVLKTGGIHCVDHGVALGTLEHGAAVDLIKTLCALELLAHQGIGLTGTADAAGAA